MLIDERLIAMHLFLIIERFTTGSKIILGVLFAILFYMIFHYAFKMVEMAYVMKNKKPVTEHFTILLATMTYWNPKPR